MNIFVYAFTNVVDPRSDGDIDTGTISMVGRVRHAYGKEL